METTKLRFNHVDGCVVPSKENTTKWRDQFKGDKYMGNHLFTSWESGFLIALDLVIIKEI